MYKGSRVSRGIYVSEQLWPVNTKSENNEGRQYCNYSMKNLVFDKADIQKFLHLLMSY